MQFRLVRSSKFGSASSIALILASIPLAAQAQGQDAASEAGADIVVVGSQIQGAKTTAALPVTVVSQQDIVNTAAVSGDDLFRSIPQMGDVTFNSAYLPNSSNSARGDVNSVNLRNLGIGNTLVLLNGRRMVNHPTSQANDQNVPVLSVNSNAVPVSGISRMEVLRDGAGAIYGSDAVAGVVNMVLDDKFEGLTASTQYGGAEGTGMREFNANMKWGTKFADGRGGVTLFADYTHRTSLDSSDQSFTASADRRSLFEGTRFEGASSLNGTSTSTPWAYLQAAGGNTVYQNGTALTTSTGYFHIQPETNAGCLSSLGSGICIDDGALATSGVDSNLRYDSTASADTSIMPKVDRANIFATGHYDLTDDVEIFGEGSYYYAKSWARQTSNGFLSSVPITIPASNYYNPFGPVAFADGTTNPNRLSGLTNVPDEGLNVTLRGYNFADAGANIVEVKNTSYRLLGGIRFQALGMKWESAALYSAARVHDRSDGISNTLLQ